MSIFIDIFDVYVIGIFAIDLYYRWQETPRFFPYVKKHFLDIIATIPFNLIFSDLLSSFNTSRKFFAPKKLEFNVCLGHLKLRVIELTPAK